MSKKLKSPSQAQINARKCNWEILRLRGVYAAIGAIQNSTFLSPKIKHAMHQAHYWIKKAISELNENTK